MAEQTVPEMITDLESQIIAVQNEINNHQGIRELEEGGAGSRFRTQFANIDSLYTRKNQLENRLRTLRMGS